MLGNNALSTLIVAVSPGSDCWNTATHITDTNFEPAELMSKRRMLIRGRRKSAGDRHGQPQCHKFEFLEK